MRRRRHASVVVLVEERLRVLVVFLERRQRRTSPPASGLPWSFVRPAPTVFSVRSSTISKLRELLVAVVLALVAQPAGLVLGRLDVWRALRSAALTTSVRCTMRSARARAASRMSSPSRRDLGEELLALLEQPAGGAQLVGQALDRLLEQLEHLVPVDHHRRRQRHRPGAGDQVERPAAAAASLSGC